jgi:hypothetical protein
VIVLTLSLNNPKAILQDTHLGTLQISEP